MKGTSRLTKRLSVSVASLGLIMSALPSLTVLAVDTTPVRNSGGYIGRNFDETFDKMFDDFNRDTLADGSANGLWWAVTDGAVNFTDRTSYLEAHYSATQLNTADGAIYKVASPSNSQGAYDFLVLKMRGSDGASIADLNISFRYDDNHSLLTVGLDQLVDPDLDPLAELTSDYQLYIIDLASSLDGLEFGGANPIAAANSMVGFHLHAKDTADAGTLGLGEVYWTDNAATLGYNASAGTDYLLDNFQRENVGEAEDGIWWRGAGPEAEIIGKWLVMDASVNSAMYKSAGYDAGDPTGNYDNFVIRAKGGVGGEDVMVTPYYNTGTGDIWGTPKALSTLVSADGEALPDLTSDFQTLVVSLSENGWDAGVQGFQFDLAAGAGEVHFDEVFFTNMEVDLSDMDTEFPLLNDEDIVVFDDFNRASVGATAEYDANNPVALANGLLYIIAYAGMDRMSMDDGSLVFDTTTNADYMQYTVGGQHFNDGSYEYVVFKVKGTDGASLENLRLSTINDTGSRSPIVWGNGGLKSGNGLPIPDFDDADYPYVTADGYMYVMIDIASSGLTAPTHGFDLFYSGGGKLLIDSIFFANKLPLEDLENQVVFDDFNRDVVAEGNHWWTDAGQATIVEGALKLSAPANEHAYYRTASPVNNYDNPLPYLAITMKGAEGTTLDSLRLQTIGDAVIEVFANQGVLVDPYGQPIPALTTSYQTYIIDLAASGLSTKAQGIGVIFGDWASGELYVDNISFVGMKDLVDHDSHKMFDDFERAAVAVSEAHWWVDAGGAAIVDGALVLDASVEATHTWYRAASPSNNHDAPMKYLTITMKGAEGTTLNAVRIQTIVGANSVEVAANSGALVDELGRPIAELTTEYQTYVIDLEASGLLVNAEGVGIIFGDWDTGILSVAEIGFVDKISNLSALDDIADPYTTAIEVVNPTKVVYEFNEDLDLAGLVVNAVLSNGETEVIANGDYTVTGYSKTTAGEQTLTVTFDGFEYTFEVTVNAEVIPVVPSYINIVTLPSKVTYEIGETLDLTGLLIRVTMSNNTTLTLSSSQYTVTGFSSTTAGAKTITVTYGTITNTFMVTVVDPEVESSGCFGGLGQDGNTGFGYLAGLFIASYLIKKILVK